MSSQRSPFVGREKGDGEGVALGLVGLGGRQTGGWRGDLVFVTQVNTADAWVIGVDGRQQPSLQEYLLVAQDRVSVERYRRDGELWTLTEVTSLDRHIELPSIGCTLALADIYDKVEGLD